MDAGRGEGGHEDDDDNNNNNLLPEGEANKEIFVPLWSLFPTCLGPRAPRRSASGMRGWRSHRPPGPSASTLGQPPSIKGIFF